MWYHTIFELFLCTVEEFSNKHSRKDTREEMRLKKLSGVKSTKSICCNFAS